MQNYAKAHSGGLIIEIDEHKWRGREERVSAAYYYAQSKYAKDAINTKTPQAVVKVIGYRHGSKAVRGTIEYIARIDASEKGEELALETQDGELIKGKEAIAALVKEWKAGFEKSPVSTFIKGDNADQIKKALKARHATHILLSADCEPNATNYAKLEKTARDMLRREFDDKGYDYVFVVHKDTQHPHVHVVVKNKQRELGLDKRRKLRLNPNDLLHLRRQFAFELERNGIEQIATRSVDTPGR
ncbi:MAG: relaxase/mobilization nuclease domain-containing protein, partial [Helicobacteraceae bacterium]|nr:relaxase/mobilization nuclease domain-containing protein [Helicobacteraceae bacterium]